jgi:two-component system, chemotaxis family, sensor kinase CheA
VVDRINDTEEIVVKPLGKQLKSISCFAGATIMGDGRVALILDVLGLAQHARVLSEVRERVITADTEAESEEAGSGRQTLLLFDAGSCSRMAIPLSTVARLEEFPRANIERAGGRQVVQYRGQILPLIRVAEYVAGGARHALSEDSEKLQVVVYSEAGRSVGLVVDHINDIVEETLVIKSDAVRQGILGSAVVQRRVTDLLDISAIIRAAAEEASAPQPCTA